VFTPIVIDGFGPEAEPLRAAFDARFAEPRAARDHRFVWDWWHVPGQYTSLRTPAWTYFPRAVYARWHRRVVAWGREVLGCHDISPPWLSCYVDGCRQELHGDLPHGPFAFVYSLTRWRGRRFEGGETILLRDAVLAMWSEFDSVRAVESAELVRAIEPRFGRLVVFDPRVPHGVREVRGTQDPRDGRLVVHGWFVQPRPFVRGPLRAAAVATRIDELVAALPAVLGDVPLAGLVSLRVDVAAAGHVRDVRILADTTRVSPEHERARRRAVRRIVAGVAAWRMPRANAPSRVTLPLVFERG
jgi:hypothetical protein